MLIAATVAGLGLVAALDARGGSAGSMTRVTVELVGSPLFLAVAAVITVSVCYRELPPVPPRWPVLLLPALVVGLVEVALSQLFMFVVPRLVGVAELAGSLASAFVALAWLSLSFQAFLLGSAWVGLRQAESPDASAGAMPSAGSAPLEGAAASTESRSRRE
jgi:uncharacterized BrkB/YihY/UPF0761 family membrane protein